MKYSNQMMTTKIKLDLNEYCIMVLLCTINFQSQWVIKKCLIQTETGVRVRCGAQCTGAWRNQGLAEGQPLRHWRKYK